MADERRNRENPSNKTIHFRRIRELATEIADYEHINVNEYDLYNMTVYKDYGCSLMGKGVSFDFGHNSSERASCFIYNNYYHIFEIPSKNNKKGYTGKYLFLIKNLDFDYWLFGKMSHRIDYEKTRETKLLIEKVNFEPYGKYSVLFKENNDIDVYKEIQYCDCDFGTNFKKYHFDFNNGRKKAYGVRRVELLDRILNGRKTENETGIIDDKDVIIYKKKRY